MAAWTYLIADLRTNVVIGELPLGGVRMSKVLNGSGQLQAKANLGDPKVQARNVYDMSTPARRVVYALRDSRPFWGGIIWARDFDRETNQLDIACADFWSYFDHRYILELLTLPAAASYVAGFSKIFTQVDQNAIARGLVTLAQSHTGGNIGIVVDSATSGILRDRTYEGYDLKDVGSALRDIANLIDGCDIVFDVGTLDPTTGRPTRIMRTGTPFISQQGVAWRWDLGGNMLSYKWSSGGGIMATRTFAQGTGVERGAMFAVAENTTRYADGWPLLETDDVYPTVSEFPTLQAHANGQLSALDLPLAIPKLRVRGDLPPILGEYAVGDNGRMVIPSGDLFFTAGLDLPVRIISMTVDIDDQGQEKIELVCQSGQEIG